MIDRNYIIKELIKIINRKEVKDELTLTNFFENLFYKEGKYFRDSIEEDNNIIAFLYGVYIFEELSFDYEEEYYYMGTYGGENNLYYFGLNSIKESNIDILEEDFYTFLSKIYINDMHFLTFLDKINFHSGV